MGWAAAAPVSEPHTTQQQAVSMVVLPELGDMPISASKPRAGEEYRRPRSARVEAVQDDARLCTPGCAAASIAGYEIPSSSSLL